jgi:hypothetical protein
MEKIQKKVGIEKSMTKNDSKIFLLILPNIYINFLI